MRRVVFWLATLTIAYTYVLFPFVVLLKAWIRRRPYHRADVTPTVSAIVVAHNEEPRIGSKLESLLALDYPPDRLEIVVASDGSSDGTDELVSRLAASHPGRLRLLSLPRGGKAVALNAAVTTAEGEILVFTDADGHLAHDAIRAIVRPFADPAVGGVAGDERYLPSSGQAGTVQGQQSYWDLDRRLKVAESRAGHAISATGSLYALRRSLFEPVPGGVTDDFFASTGVIARGFRLVFAPEAIAYSTAVPSTEAEFRRKTRIMTRGFTAVLARRELLDPRRYGFYSLQLLSHKVLRRLMVFPLLAVAFTSPRLWRGGLVYRLAVLAQATIYGAGAAGLVLRKSELGQRRLLAIPAYFCLVNAASLWAVWNVARRRRIERWDAGRG